ncbi:serine/threonine-protein kinase [Allorhodopirellula heiligendammensis]|uniref:Serine/threonine-protein kinase PknA n=1 Tax=Allorhodopirellula heiligendammensis TaxID=2714739 RepID=A0A5C6BW91_9BACT|nr:serine/threonine-protein kinase [Allorhodopirellula heiligendammensis]TWU15917.1 Serine/threonine-protein kinase PknA [Allorhodopirellula heiligendammensis]
MSEFECLGPYKLGKVIGRGGMGSVYEATHVTSGDQVAVKLIAQHVADDMRFRRRFDAEVETLRRLRHPGIVHLIGYGEESGRLFYAMELVRGESLQQRIRDVKRMSWLPAVDIAIQITSALKHAHDMGVIHRDLKPANLLLTAANEVKIVDFGIAKLFGYGDQTLAGSVLGTADYMAPEQAGDGPITPRTDLYALGSVMYAMMAGRSPFAGKKLTQVIEALQQDQAVPLDLINPDIPHEVVEIVHDLLEKDTRDRPPTAIAVNKRLKATRAGLQRGQTVSVQDQTTRNESDRHNGTNASVDSGSPDLTGGLHGDELNIAGSGTAQKNLDDARDGSSVSNSSGVFLSRGDDRATAGTDIPNNTGSRTDDSETASPTQSPTSFQTVEQDHSNDGYFHGDVTPAPTHHWLQIASFTAMLAILAGGVYLFLRATRVPSADSMYATLQTAAREDELTLNESLMDRFLVHYPDSEHVHQVERWKQQADLERTLKRFATRSRRLGGVEKLNPAAQTFIEAMELRTTSPVEAKKKLLAWQVLFTDDQATPSAADDELEQVDPLLAIDHLAKLVREELLRLDDQDAPLLETDRRVEMLQKRIQASGQMSPEKRTKLLRSVIELYGNHSWARPVVDQAAAMLATPAENVELIPSDPDMQ